MKYFGVDFFLLLKKVKLMFFNVYNQHLFIKWEFDALGINKVISET